MRDCHQLSVESRIPFYLLRNKESGHRERHLNEVGRWNAAIGLLDPDAHPWSFVEGKESHVHQFFLGWVGSEPARGVKGKR